MGQPSWPPLPLANVVADGNAVSAEAGRRTPTVVAAVTRSAAAFEFLKRPRILGDE